MKLLVVAFLCTLAAVQGRSALGDLAAAPGENPYVVHIRVTASDTNGLLNTCAGSLIGSQWVLTIDSCIKRSRFIWLRFGAVDVTRPELVIEGNLATHVLGNIALINLNRAIEESDNIGHVVLAEADDELPATGKFCRYGAENDAPGNQLVCASVPLEPYRHGINAVTNGTQFDMGAPLVSEGVLIGAFARVGETSVFSDIRTSRGWIKAVTGL